MKNAMHYKQVATAFIASFLFLGFISTVGAQTITKTPTVTPKTSITPKLSTTPTAEPSPTVDPQINQLKERIASKVAQLKLVEKRGITGTVTDTTDTQITLIDANGDTRYVDVDELTKFSSPSNRNYGISDISKGTHISIIGLYNRESKRMLGRFVDLVNFPFVINGAIGSLDKPNFQIVMVDGDNKKYTVDIQSVTKTYTYSQSAGLAKAGFSRLETLKRVTVVGTKGASGDLISALRVIELPDLPINPTIKQQVLEGLMTATTSLTPTITPVIKAK